MIIVSFILLLLAFVCFLIAAFVGHAGGERSWTRTNFIALGLALWVLTLIIAVFPR